MARVLAAGVLATAMALGGCDNGPSAVQTRDRASADASDSAPLALTAMTEAPVEAAPVAEPSGPVTANRRETADAKVQRLFDRNGAAFGARSADDYLVRIKTFTGSPPRDADSVKRPNGDTLYYQASTNTFAVVARDGTPRTMFKPDDGAAYWAEQKARAPTFGRRRTAAAE